MLVKCIGCYVRERIVPHRPRYEAGPTSISSMRSESETKSAKRDSKDRQENQIRRRDKKKAGTREGGRAKTTQEERRRRTENEGRMRAGRGGEREREPFNPIVESPASPTGHLFAHRYCNSVSCVNVPDVSV